MCVCLAETDGVGEGFPCDYCKRICVKLAISSKRANRRSRCCLASLPSNPSFHCERARPLAQPSVLLAASRFFSADLSGPSVKP